MAHRGSRSVRHVFPYNGAQNALNLDFGANDPAVTSPNGVYLHWFIYIPAATSSAMSTGQIKLHFQRYSSGAAWMVLGMGPEIAGSRGTIRLIGDAVPANPPAGGRYTYPVDTWIEVVVHYRRDTAAHTGTARWWIGSGGSLAYMGSLAHPRLGSDSPTASSRASFSTYSQNAASYPYTVYTDDVTIADGFPVP